MISSEANAQVKEIVKLQRQSRQRSKSGCFVAEGMKLLGEAAERGMLERLYVAESASSAVQGQMAGAGKLFSCCPCEVVSDSVFQKISETVTPQGLLGIVRMPAYHLEDVLQHGGRAWLLLEDLRDPGNLGTIMRTAEGAGMSGVILSRGCVDLFNPKVVRATMGAIFRVPFVYVDDLAEVVGYIREKGHAVYGTAMEGSVLYDKPDYAEGVAVVIGNEANGISRALMETLSGTIRIPMAGELESLNAAVAAAVVMYEIARQRRR